MLHFTRWTVFQEKLYPWQALDHRIGNSRLQRVTSKRKGGGRLKTGFIGAGKVGCSLGKYLSIHGTEVTGYFDRDTCAAKEAAGFTDSVAFASIEALTQESDVLFITVPDALITSVYDEIRPCDIKGKYICHCSGSISSEEAFPGIGEAGAYGYSVHPLFAVSDRFETYRELADAFFTIEGDSTHVDDMRSMLEGAGLRVRVIDPADKAKYHLAAVMVSNLVMALLQSGIDKLTECGFTEGDAREALGPLAEKNIGHAIEEGPAKALTGPVERGDVQTIRKHLDTIKDPEERRLYLLLSGRLLHLARRKNPDRDYGELEALLEENDIHI